MACGSRHRLRNHPGPDRQRLNSPLRHSSQRTNMVHRHTASRPAHHEAHQAATGLQFRSRTHRPKRSLSTSLARSLGSKAIGPRQFLLCRSLLLRAISRAMLSSISRCHWSGTRWGIALPLPPSISSSRAGILCWQRSSPAPGHCLRSRRERDPRHCQ